MAAPHFGGCNKTRWVVPAPQIAVNHTTGTARSSVKSMSNSLSNVLERIGELKIVPVVSIEDAGDAVALGEALTSAGLPLAEVTFRTAAAADAIRALSRDKNLLVGAG